MSIPLRVRDYMTPDVVTVALHDEIMHVVRVLIEHDVSGVLVVDGGGAPIGVVTERDCIAVAADAGYYDEPGGPVEEFMSAPVETVGPDDNLADLAVRMAASRYRRFPVVAGGRLIGIISRRDVLRALDSGAWFARAKDKG